MGNPYAPSKKAETKAEDKGTTAAPSEDPKTQNTQEHVELKKEAEKPALTVPEATMEGILDWVGENKERAAAAIDHEKSLPKPRKTLLSKLGDI